MLTEYLEKIKLKIRDTLEEPYFLEGGILSMEQKPIRMVYKHKYLIHDNFSGGNVELVYLGQTSVAGDTTLYFNDLDRNQISYKEKDLKRTWKLLIDISEMKGF